MDADIETPHGQVLTEMTIQLLTKSSRTELQEKALPVLNLGAFLWHACQSLPQFAAFFQRRLGRRPRLPKGLVMPQWEDLQLYKYVPCTARELKPATGSDCPYISIYRYVFMTLPFCCKKIGCLHAWYHHAVEHKAMLPACVVSDHACTDLAFAERCAPLKISTLQMSTRIMPSRCVKYRGTASSTTQLPHAGPHTQEPDAHFSSRLERMTLPHVITQNPSYEKRCTHRWNAAKQTQCLQAGWLYTVERGTNLYTHSKKHLIHRYIYIYIYSFMQVASHPSSQRYLHTVVYVIEGSTHITRRRSNSGCSQACFCTSGNLEAAAACVLILICR